MSVTSWGIKDLSLAVLAMRDGTSDARAALVMRTDVDAVELAGFIQSLEELITQAVREFGQMMKRERS